MQNDSPIRGAKYRDNRLPRHWRLTRFADGAICITVRTEPILKLGLAPVCLFMGLAIANQILPTARYGNTEIGIIMGILSGAFLLGGVHLLCYHEIWRLKSNSFEVRRIFLWPYYSAHFSDAEMVLTKTFTDDGELRWELKLVKGKLELRLHSETHNHGMSNTNAAYYPPSLMDIGLFLREHTGWPLILPE